MRVSELGEFGLIDRIAARVSVPHPEVVVGIGDDVAVLRTSGPDYLLATVDVQVEKVHFRRECISAYQLGRKVVAINASDIAAMGGEVAWALVSLLLPRDTEVSFVDDLYRGMQEQILQAGGVIVGGNLSRTGEDIAVDFVLLGKASPERLILRSGARDGDVVLVTGYLGESRAGLELLQTPELTVSEASRNLALARHLTPQPRLAEGRVLAQTGWVHAMADVSDGLLSDLRHICRASGVGAEVSTANLPVGASCEEIARAVGKDPIEWALTGGEDYELLFTADPGHAPEIQRILEKETGTPCRAIGRMDATAAGIVVDLPHGEKSTYPMGATGWDHFAGRQGPPGTGFQNQRDE